MDTADLIGTLRFFGRENGRLEREECSVVNPTFVFTTPNTLPDVNKKPEWMKAITTFDEGCPVFVVVTNSTAELLYTNLLHTYKASGFLYVVNVNTVDENDSARSAIINLLLHNDLNIDMVTFTMWDAEYVPADLDAVLVCRPKNIACISVANDPYNTAKEHTELSYNMPSSTMVMRYDLIKSRLRKTSILPYYASAFNLQFLLWLADRGLDFTILQDKNVPCTDVADHITADALAKLHTERPFIFTKTGAINVKYIHDLATESAKLITL